MKYNHSVTELNLMWLGYLKSHKDFQEKCSCKICARRRLKVLLESRSIRINT